MNISNCFKNFFASSHLCQNINFICKWIIAIKKFIPTYVHTCSTPISIRSASFNTRNSWMPTWWSLNFCVKFEQSRPNKMLSTSEKILHSLERELSSDSCIPFRDEKLWIIFCRTGIFLEIAQSWGRIPSRLAMFGLAPMKKKTLKRTFPTSQFDQNYLLPKAFLQCHHDNYQQHREDWSNFGYL